MASHKALLIMGLLGLSALALALPQQPPIEVVKPGQEVVVDTAAGTTDVAGPGHNVHVEGTGGDRIVSVESASVNVTRWGGCGWLGRPCLKIEILAPGRMPQVLASDQYPERISVLPGRVSVTI